MSFTQVNLNQNKWQGDITKLSSVFTKYLEQYKKDCAITKVPHSFDSVIND